MQAYHGTAQHLPTVAERERAIAAAAEAVRATIAALRARSASRCEFVSGAGTGTYRIEGTSGLWNELQAGSYLFMDTDYARIGDKDGGRYTDFRHSLFVLSTVISVPTADRAIVDAGLKSYSGEKGPPWVHGRDDILVTGISDEHGKLQLGPKAQRLRIGDRVMLIPGHCDPTINLHDWYVAVRGGRVGVAVADHRARREPLKRSVARTARDVLVRRRPMKLTLSQLEALFWISRLGSVRAAAARLNITQPALSLRIKELEATLGGKLLNRGSYRATLTALGPRSRPAGGAHARHRRAHQRPGRTHAAKCAA